MASLEDDYLSADDELDRADQVTPSCITVKTRQAFLALHYRDLHTRSCVFRARGLKRKSTPSLSLEAHLLGVSMG